MKKVIGALLAASVVGGAVSAEIAFKLQTRVRPSFYTMDQGYKNKITDKKAQTKSTLWDFSGGNGGASHADVLNLTAKGDNCGVDVEISLQNGKSATGDGTEYWGGKGADNNGGSRGIGLDGLYRGWMNWGNFKVTVGQWDDRFINRYNKQVVEGGTGLMDGGTAKYGISGDLVLGRGKGKKEGANKVAAATSTVDKAYGKSFLFDFSNTGAIGDAKHTAFVLDYALGLDFGKFDFKAGLLANKYGEDTKNFAKGKDTFEQGAGYLAEIDFDSDAFKAEAIFKKPTEHSMGFGVYGELKAIDKLNAVLGFTLGTVSSYKITDYTVNKNTGLITINDTTKQNEIMAYAVDARVFYQIIDPLRVGLQAKFSSWQEKAAKNNGTKVKEKTNNDKADMGLEVIASAQYVMNDLFSAQFDVGLYMEDLDDEDGRDLAENYIIISPAVKFSASKQAAVSAGVHYQFAINGGDAEDFGCAASSKGKLTIPVIARIKI